MNKKDLAHELMKVPKGRFDQIDYFEHLDLNGKSTLAIKLAEMIGFYNAASEIAIKNGDLENAIRNAYDFLEDHNNFNGKDPDLPLRVLSYLERRGAKNFSGWEKKKIELNNHAIELYSKKINEVKNNLESLKEIKNKLEKISLEQLK